MGSVVVTITCPCPGLRPDIHPMTRAHEDFRALRPSWGRMTSSNISEDTFPIAGSSAFTNSPVLFSKEYHPLAHRGAIGAALQYHRFVRQFVPVGSDRGNVPPGAASLPGCRRSPPLRIPLSKRGLHPAADPLPFPRTHLCVDPPVGDDLHVRSDRSR